MKKIGNKGYTLIELLVVAALLITISGFIIGILFSSIRGGTKSRTSNDVSQNGNQALSIISRVITSSTAVVDPITKASLDCAIASISSTSINLEQVDGSIIKFACNPSGTLTQEVTPFNGTAQSPTNLIDSNSVIVNNASCTFTCRQPNTDIYAAPIIDVSYTVLQKSVSTAMEDQAQAIFNTSVSLRNFNPF